MPGARSQARRRRFVPGQRSQDGRDRFSDSERLLKLRATLILLVRLKIFDFFWEMSFEQTMSRWRGRLPHWEVAERWHFITIRCQGSLPPEARVKIREIHRALSQITATDPEFAQLQRQYFLSTEKYLDQNFGFAPFVQTTANRSCLEDLERLEGDGWLVGEAVIMPNHLHCVIYPGEKHLPLREALSRLKGRSARRLNVLLKRQGRFWQQDWFDRWMRNEAELDKTINYIRQNPVKAKLVDDWRDYPWRISKYDASYAS